MVPSLRKMEVKEFVLISEGLIKLLRKVHTFYHRLAPVLKTSVHQFIISYTCRQSNSNGSVL